MTNKEKLEFLTGILVDIDSLVRPLKGECFSQLDQGYSESEIEIPVDDVRRIFEDIIDSYKVWNIIING